MTLAVFDALLFLALPALALRVLTARGPRPAAIFFIVFGLLVALSWVRLAAPDVALAEAAIGAGVTGALLLAATGGRGSAQTPARHAASTRAHVAGVTLVLLLGAGLAWVVSGIEPTGAAAMRAALAETPRSGVSHPVTAVVVAFRAYDTLIESAVLLAAALIAAALPAGPVLPAPRRASPVLTQVTAATVPAAVIVAVFLLWIGATSTGGAFQAGSVLAGALLLARFSGSGPGPPDSRLQPLLPGIGVLLFATAGAAGTFAAGSVMGWPAATAGGWIVAIESALTISIATTLVSFFDGRSAP